MNVYEEGKKVSLLTILMNVFLCLFKVMAGIFGKSSAMIADGIHTLSDVITTIMVILGLKISSKKEDEEHPYGHEKFEPVYAKIISTLLLITGIFIAYEGVKVLLSGNYNTPGTIALIAAVVSIIAKEFMYRYTIYTAKKIKSISMEADAWHHRSDALSSIGTFIGIFGARAGLKILDPLTSIIVSFFIIKVAIEFYLKSVKELVDTSADKETIATIKEETLKINGVENIYNLKTRTFGSKVYVDIEIYVDSKMTVEESHRIATAVHDNLENKIENIKHCMVHVEPFYSEQTIL
ncbi:cation diffusion facilitator family transporter [Clostridium tetanomorphum]|uniref:Cation transporter n=1 Tax=Clostridium tetanomorphum TaxID=1553 RepID=A0A923J0L7_CLOTT|nr:cation diffusion facilitator family transporter [Clostridium tetanomorphum]KAJ51001.1 cobalt-zinc-cadmium resistance protein czcD [Clostridium tetanomorphum DSM 665]MBC2396368.1 cation transporter [Clostridium tetanomorphum]MBP1863403.1 cation diffusion facilitator family transporter [Clostridium tetanomorphum]NRS83500.1 cation diffusion facilitator family transporter [Clostridium tetanomorphum]NRZ96700.1 cation diffusion facilitator family transporter [Clostridium tetanomorphum]